MLPDSGNSQSYFYPPHPWALFARNRSIPAPRGCARCSWAMFSRVPMGEGLAVKFLMEACDLENILWIEHQTQMAQGSFQGQFSEPWPWQLVHLRYSLPEEEAIRWPGSNSMGVELMELDTISIHLPGFDSNCLLLLFLFQWKTFQPAAQLFLVFPSLPLQLHRQRQVRDKDGRQMLVEKMAKMWCEIAEQAYEAYNTANAVFFNLSERVFDGHSEKKN